MQFISDFDMGKHEELIQNTELKEVFKSGGAEQLSDTGGAAYKVNPTLPC